MSPNNRNKCQKPTTKQKKHAHVDVSTSNADTLLFCTQIVWNKCLQWTRWNIQSHWIDADCEYYEQSIKWNIIATSSLSLSLSLYVRGHARATIIFQSSSDVQLAFANEPYICDQTMRYLVRYEWKSERGRERGEWNTLVECLGTAKTFIWRAMTCKLHIFMAMNRKIAILVTLLCWFALQDYALINPLIRHIT